VGGGVGGIQWALWVVSLTNIYCIVLQLINNWKISLWAVGYLFQWLSRLVTGPAVGEVNMMLVNASG
jgi:hypothetical protein